MPHTVSTLMLPPMIEITILNSAIHKSNSFTASNIIIIVMFRHHKLSVTGPGFPSWGGAPTPGFGAKTYHLAKFLSKKYDRAGWHMSLAPHQWLLT